MGHVRTIEGAGVEISCLVSDSIDDPNRPLAVCVHGFPDTPHTWRHLTSRLEAEDWRVAAPFLRGYAPSGVPDDGCLQTGVSSLDVIAIHDRLGGGSDAIVVGHDWGAPIAYGAAGFAPDRWARVVGLAVPPGPALATAFLTNPDQLKRSWYMFFFQHPLADLVVPADDLAFIDMIWRDWSPSYTPEAGADVDAVKAALGDPEHLAAALGYYRATLGGVGVQEQLAEVQASTSTEPPQPLLYLHGAADGCIGAEVAQVAADTSGSNVTVEIVADTGHFLHLEAPTHVNDRIMEFLT